MRPERIGLSAALLPLLLSTPLTVTAQSSVTLGGQIKIGMDHIGYSGGLTAKGQPNPGLSATRLSDNSSYFYLKGEEQLGGGTKAFFHWEDSFRSDSDQLGTARFRGLGFINPRWGRVLLGRWSTYFASDSLLSPAGIRDALPYASGTLDVLGPIGRRGRYFSGGFLSNTVRYDSPQWAGFGFSASYSFDTETIDQSSNHTLNFNPVYVNGPLMLYANILRRNHQPNAAGNFKTDYDQTAIRLGAGYEFKWGLKVAALWDRNKVDGTAIEGAEQRRDAWAIPISYRVGAQTFSVTYGRANPYQTAGVRTADTGATMTSFGYEYALSKRTSLAANLSTVRNQAQAGYDFWYPTIPLPETAGSTGFRSRYTYVGIKHVF